MHAMNAIPGEVPSAKKNSGQPSHAQPIHAGSAGIFKISEPVSFLSKQCCDPNMSPTHTHTHSHTLSLSLSLSLSLVLLCLWWKSCIHSLIMFDSIESLNP